MSTASSPPPAPQPAGPPPAALRVPQDRETVATTVARQRFTYRYAYARSADSLAAGDPGQDYLEVWEDGHRIAFAVCDGVSQSFIGDLASRVLGPVLVEWLWQFTEGVSAASLHAAAQRGDAEALALMRDNLDARLAALVAPATDQVMGYVLPPHARHGALRAVLEHKRRLGTESNFAAGLLDASAGCLLLAWLGDCRLRIWNHAGERTAELGDTFRTGERWSSRRGAVGTPHLAAVPAVAIRRVVAYTDGLARLDADAVCAPDDADLDAVITAAGQHASSDDVSYLEVLLHAAQPCAGGASGPFVLA